MSLLQTALAPTGPSSSTPKSAPGFCADPQGAKHHVLGTGCPGGAVPGAGSIFPARGDPAGRELCLPKVGHAVNSSDVVGRAKNTGGAECFPGSCEGPRPRRVGLWPSQGHQGPRAAGARLGKEQVMEKPLWGCRCTIYRRRCLSAGGV